jgi:uncharacterized protein (TIGR00645 family)
MNRFERMLESGIFASRWLLAPFYLGLVVCLGLLLLHFLIKLGGFIPRVPRADDTEVILGILSLVDVAFTANLVLIVIFSGYENFVSKFDATTHDRPDWMTRIDFSGLKQKLMTSIVAISAIQVLKAFMDIDSHGADTTKLAWLVGVHLAFVTSMLMLAISDRLAEDVKTKEHLDASKPKGK